MWIATTHRLVFVSLSFIWIDFSLCRVVSQCISSLHVECQSPIVSFPQQHLSSYADQSMWSSTSGRVTIGYLSLSILDPCAANLSVGVRWKSSSTDANSEGLGTRGDQNPVVPIFTRENERYHSHSCQSWDESISRWFLLAITSFVQGWSDSVSQWNENKKWISFAVSTRGIHCSCSREYRCRAQPWYVGMIS